MVLRSIFLATFLIFLGGCRQTINYWEPNTLIIETPEGVVRYELPVVAVGQETNCRIETPIDVIELSDVDCALLHARMASLKRIEERVARLERRQNEVLRVAVESAVITATNAALIEAIELDKKEIEEAIATLTKSMDELDANTKSFLAALIDQYRQLHERIDRSIPNYEE